MLIGQLVYHQNNGVPAGIRTQDHRLKVGCFRPTKLRARFASKPFYHHGVELCKPFRARLTGVWKDEGRMGFVPSAVPYVFVSFQPLSIYYSNYTLVEASSQQLFLVVTDGIEPSQRAYETHVRTERCHYIMVSRAGFEPAFSAFQGRQLNQTCPPREI